MSDAVEPQLLDKTVKASAVVHGIPLEVFYNGMPKELAAKENETIKSLLDRAIQAFGPLQNPHLLALFTKDGNELPDAQTVKEAGLKPHDQLLLRPSAVRGGTN